MEDKMIVPFVYDLEVLSDYDHISVFYFYLTMIKKMGGALISHERYFIKPEKFYSQIMTREQLKASAEFLEYDLPENEDIDKIGKYSIPQKFEDSMIEDFKSRVDCWTYILSHEYYPLEELIGNILDAIVSDYHQKIQAILCFYEPIALRTAAEKRDIKVIHQEGTMFRKPFYRMAGYFDFKEGYGKGELEERYYKFLKEIAQKDIKLFSRKEILALFMTEQGLNELEKMDQIDSESLYEIGIGLSEFNLGVNLKDSLINTDEILLEARKAYPIEKIITRSRYQTTGYDDNSPTAFHFILKCKRIAAIRSNLSFEAMLLGKISCVYGNSPYAFIGNRGISDKSISKITLEFLNFTVFGYFVPWEFLCDINYIKWRLTNPTEIEIYKKHMNFYLNKRGLDDEIFNFNEGDALDYILSKQNIKADENKKAVSKPTLLDSYNILNKEHANLSNEYNRLINCYENLNKEHRLLSQNYDTLLEHYQTLLKKLQD